MYRSKIEYNFPTSVATCQAPSATQGALGRSLKSICFPGTARLNGGRGRICWRVHAHLHMGGTLGGVGVEVEGGTRGH